MCLLLTKEGLMVVLWIVLSLRIVMFLICIKQTTHLTTSYSIHQPATPKCYTNNRNISWSTWNDLHLSFIAACKTSVRRYSDSYVTNPIVCVPCPSMTRACLSALPGSIRAELLPVVISESSSLGAFSFFENWNLISAVVFQFYARPKTQRLLC